MATQVVHVQYAYIRVPLGVTHVKCLSLSSRFYNDGHHYANLHKY